MTSKISLVKNHSVLNLFRFTLRKQTPLTLLVTAFTLLICPGLLLSDANDDLMREYYLSSWKFGTFAFIIMGAAAFLVFLLLFLNFNFLFSKKAGDMYNALPVTRNQMLVTRTFGAFIGGFSLMTTSYLGLVIINFLPTVDGVSSLITINTYLFMLLSLIVITVFCLLFIVCCGGYFDTIIAFGAINLAPVFVLAILFLIAEETTKGLIIDYDLLIYLNPIALILYKLLNLPENLELESKGVIINTIGKTSTATVIGLLIFGALCTFLAIRLFKVRKGETAGEAYAFKFVSVLISLFVSMVGGFIIAGILTGFDSSFTMGFWILFIVSAILCAIAIGAITNRGFKKVKQSIVVGSVAATIMLALTISGMYVAEYNENKIPNPKNIAVIYMGETEFRDNFELITNLHKDILYSLEEDKDYDGDYFYPEVIGNIGGFHFEYVMKNGSVMRRDYWYRYPNMKSMHGDILALMQSDEFLNKYDAIVDIEREEGVLSVNSFSAKFGEMGDTETKKKTMLSIRETKELLTLFKKEMKAADLEIFSEQVCGITISGSGYYEIYIPVSFDETIEYLTDKFTSYMQKEEAEKTY